MSTDTTTIYHCSTTTVIQAEYGASGTALKLQSLAVQPLDYDPANDSQWVSNVGSALKSLSSKRKGSGPSVLIAPGSKLLTKTFKVASVEASRQPQVIAFEAGNNLPRPLSDFVWDYEVLSDDGVETEVLAVFAERNEIDGLCRTSISSGVRPSSVQAETILDYNAYRYVYSGDQPITLLINIGARTTNFLFIDNDGFVVRNVTQGGSSLTQAIADNLGIGFEEAQRIKLSYFAGGNDRSIEPTTAKMLDDNAQAYFGKLNQEITRSVVLYRRQKVGQAPQRIIVCGQSANVAGLLDFLATKQKMPVEVFNPLTQIEVAPSVPGNLLEEWKAALTVTVGEAVRMTDDKALSINLLPNTLTEELRFASQKPFFIAAAALLALAFVPPFLNVSARTEATREMAQAFSGDTAPLYTTHDAIVGNREQAEAYKQKILSLENLVSRRSNWIGFLADLQAGMQRAGHVWLESMDVNEKGDQVEVAGRLLIHDFDPANPQDGFGRAKDRVNEIISLMEGSKYVARVADYQFDTSNPRILGFRMTLVNDDKAPL
jgi:type IV pilus assembly protein PilM